MVRPWPYWPHRFLRPCGYIGWGGGEQRARFVTISAVACAYINIPRNAVEQAIINRFP